LDSVPANAFRVDSDTGEVFVTGAVTFNFENQPEMLSLRVMAKDTRGAYFITKITVHVADVNEKPTIFFAQDSATVAESATKGHLIATAYVVDVDADDAAVFSITQESNFDGVFEIDMDNGAITLAKEGGLDYEKQAIYDLVVVVTDSRGLFDQVTFTVYIENVDEMNKVYGMVFKSGQRDILSNDDAFILDLSVNKEFNFPQSSKTVNLPFGDISYAIEKIKGNIFGDVDAVGGYVDATIPVSVSLNFPDEVLPDSTIEIETTLSINNPELKGGTVGFGINVGAKLEEGRCLIQSSVVPPGTTKTFVDVDFANLSLETNKDIASEIFSAEWTTDSNGKRTASKKILDDLIHEEMDWSKYIDQALDKLNVPTPYEGNIPVTILSQDCNLEYSLFQPTVVTNLNLEQDINFTIESIDCTLQLDDGGADGGTTITYKAGDTLAYTVPAHYSDGGDSHIYGTMECKPSTTYHSQSTYSFTVSQRFDWVKATVTFYGTGSDYSPFEPIQVGTGKYLWTLEPDATISKTVDEGEFELGGFDPISFDFAIDLRN